jgi:hypothetical protein
MSNSVIDSIQPAVQLERCPFCGGPAHIHRNSDNDYDSWMIDCGNDDCEVYCVAGPLEDFEAVARQWNRRGGHKL